MIFCGLTVALVVFVSSCVGIYEFMRKIIAE